MEISELLHFVVHMHTQYVHMYIMCKCTSVKQKGNATKGSDLKTHSVPNGYTHFIHMESQ